MILSVTIKMVRRVIAIKKETFKTTKSDIIEEGKAKMRSAKEMLYIHPDECIDCGACEPECPVEAIFPEDEVPEKWTAFINKNYERFGLEA